MSRANILKHAGRSLGIAALETLKTFIFQKKECNQHNINCLEHFTVKFREWKKINKQKTLDKFFAFEIFKSNWLLKQLLFCNLEFSFWWIEFELILNLLALFLESNSFFNSARAYGYKIFLTIAIVFVLAHENLAL